jgi:hypothetical protein
MAFFSSIVANDEKAMASSNTGTDIPFSSTSMFDDIGTSSVKQSLLT